MLCRCAHRCPPPYSPLCELWESVPLSRTPESRVPVSAGLCPGIFPTAAAVAGQATAALYPGGGIRAPRARRHQQREGAAQNERRLTPFEAGGARARCRWCSSRRLGSSSAPTPPAANSRSTGPAAGRGMRRCCSRCAPWGAGRRAYRRGQTLLGCRGKGVLGGVKGRQIFPAGSQPGAALYGRGGVPIVDDGLSATVGGAGAIDLGSESTSGGEGARTGGGGEAQEERCKRGGRECDGWGGRD